MKNVASEVKLIHHRTRIALPKVELHNRISRAKVFSPHPIAENRKLIHKTETPLVLPPTV